jgi:deazaflavin-dependent oxidoreductase (nitroreductase family)
MPETLATSATLFLDENSVLRYGLGMPENDYQQPGWFTQHVFNRLVARLTRLGVSVAGSRVLEVRGRRSGEPRRTPVNLLTLDGRTYLVAARGETEWVRNLRADDGRLALILGRRRQDWQATELDDDDRLPVLRRYLDRWKWEVGAFFGGVDAKSPEAEWAAEARRHPVFELQPAP